MKKLFLSFLIFTALSCADRAQKDTCLCTMQKYQRILIKSTTTQAVLSTSEWHTVGDPEPYSTDCDLDGSLAAYGTTGALLLSDGNYSVREYEHRITCK